MANAVGRSARISGCIISTATVARVLVLGTLINYGGAPVANASSVDARADTVHDAVLCLPGPEIGMVVTYARVASRPDWMPGPDPHPVALTKPNGRPTLVMDRRGRRPPYCPIRYEPDPDLVEFGRAQYAAWRAALVRLCLALQGLPGMLVHGPTAPARPWC